MSDGDTHPDGCMCEDCKRFRARERNHEDYPEQARRERLERGEVLSGNRRKARQMGMSLEEAVRRGWM